VTNATRRSPTFRSLITKLNDSDVIVYLESRVTREGLGGYLLHRVAAHGAYRYLRVIVNPHGRDERLMAVIAHELQHAVEIARAPEVGRSETVQAFFARIGFECPGACHETIDAMNVEAAVSDEFRANRDTDGRM
jgi:hypothetical protein